MICYSCNRLVGTQWVEVCPYCGNTQIVAQNLEMRAKIETNFDPPLPPLDAGAEPPR